jgi:hypothetical protein
LEKELKKKIKLRERIEEEERKGGKGSAAARVLQACLIP